MAAAKRDRGRRETNHGQKQELGLQASVLQQVERAQGGVIRIETEEAQAGMEIPGGPGGGGQGERAEREMKHAQTRDLGGRGGAFPPGRELVFPPGREEKEKRQDNPRCFRQKTEQEKKQGGEVKQAAGALRITQVGDKGQEKEKQGERVFAFRDPGGGGGMDGMESEEQAGQPCTPEAEKRQEPPDEEGVERVQEDVDDVEGGGVLPKELELQPEPGGGDRKVIDGVPAAPDLQERRPGAVLAADERIGGDQGEIVPDKKTAVDWDIGEQDGGEEQKRALPREGGEKR